MIQTRLNQVGGYLIQGDHVHLNQQHLEVFMHQDEATNRQLIFCGSQKLHL
jgi:hypothetical protein